jgi:hypothetical protein
MTLKVRNRLLLILFLFAVCCGIINTLLFIRCLTQGSFSTKMISELSREMLPDLFKTTFMPYSPQATAVAIIFFNAYIIASIALIYSNFEKTQAIEIIFFGGFLAGCMCEGLRLIPVFMNIWKSDTLSIAIITRFALGGRILAVAALFFSVMFSTPENRQYVERNFLIMLAISLMTACCIPLNNVRFITQFIVPWGMEKEFFLLRLALIVACTIALANKALTNKSKEMFHEIIGIIMLYTGHGLLYQADSYTLAGIGAVVLSAGTVFYMRTMHKIYLWK